jgi:predicted alpha/beta-hydrolase family hydrolase
MTPAGRRRDRLTPPRQLATPLGPARVTVSEPTGDPVGTLALGHGAGGGIEAKDLVAVTRAAAAAGWRVLRVEQPWRVAGKPVAAPPPQLDVGWRAVLTALREEGGLRGPLVLGGRSAGARVACRSADEQGAAGVLALAFPLHPPGRPDKSRADELHLVRVPLLIVQGERDPFGGPAEVIEALGDHPTARVLSVPGDHSLSRELDSVRAAVTVWLAGLTGP